MCIAEDEAPTKGGSKYTSPPDEFICPLTKELMVDPVVSRYGDSFERKAILEWLAEGNNYCPVTGNPLRPSCLVSNKSLEWKIRCWLHEHGQNPPEHDDFEYINGIAGVVAIVPERFKCLLTKELMEDPVMSQWGHNFERKAILKYIDDNSDTCPVTGKSLPPHSLVPNKALQHEIHEWLEQNGDHGAELPELGSIDDTSSRPLHSPNSAIVGVRGDHAVEEMRHMHAEKLKEQGLPLTEDDDEGMVKDPFSATTVVDKAHDTMQSLGHVY